MYKLVLILKVLYELEEFYFSWDKVGNHRSDMFKFDVITSAIKFTFSFRNRPACRTVPRLMFVLAL